MYGAKTTTTEQRLSDKIESLIAIGAATATNCIPCFEHLYEKAISAGVTLTEIKRAADIAGQVENGAHIALTNSAYELLGIKEPSHVDCNTASQKSCSC